MGLPMGLAPPWGVQAAPGPSSQSQPGTGSSRMQLSPSQPGPWLQCLSPEVTSDGKKGPKHPLILPLCPQDVVTEKNHSNPGFLGGPGTEKGQILLPAGVRGEGEHKRNTVWGQGGAVPSPLRAPSTCPVLPHPLWGCSVQELSSRGRGKRMGQTGALHKAEILWLQGEVA